MPMSLMSHTLEGPTTEARSPQTLEQLEHDLRSQLRTLMDDHYSEYQRLTKGSDQSPEKYRQMVAKALLQSQRAIAGKVALLVAEEEAKN